MANPIGNKNIDFNCRSLIALGIKYILLTLTSLLFEMELHR